MTEDPGVSKRSFAVSKSTVIIVLAAVSVLALMASGAFYALYQKSRSKEVSQAKIITKISRAVELPAETPTSVTVTSKDRLSNKQLAAKVQDGDMLLVFAGAKRLVVYRPSNGKVVDMLTFANTTQIEGAKP